MAHQVWRTDRRPRTTLIPAPPRARTTLVRAHSHVVRRPGRRPNKPSSPRRTTSQESRWYKKADRSGRTSGLCQIQFLSSYYVCRVRIWMCRCDWGECDGVLCGWRWSASHGWLPVCAAHSVYVVERVAWRDVMEVAGAVARVAFFGGPWADQVHEVDPPRLRMVVPVPRVIPLVPGPLEPVSADQSAFVYELRPMPMGGVKAYYPARSRLGVS